MTNSADKPYVFISYAHVDQEVVLPIIRAMQDSGINIWYDGGIAAGSEWPEYIAEKVLGCTKFVLFISEAYLRSQNCKREINFAISRKKDILSVYLEDVVLSPGMEMQLGTYQAFFRKRFADHGTFCRSLCAEAFFKDCLLETASAPHAAPAVSAAPAQTPYTAPAASAAPAQASHTATAYTAPAEPVRTASFAPKTEPSARPVKSRVLAAILAFFLGTFGVHRFYLGQYVWGIVYVLLCSTGIPTLVSIVEAIMMLITTDDKFAARYKCRVR